MGGVYVFYLVGVEAGTATYLTSSEWASQIDRQREVRKPRLLSASKFNEWMATLDCTVPILRDEVAYRRWLDSGKGWAAADEAVALQLFPQLVSARTECMYVQLVKSYDIFVDVGVVRDVVLITRGLRLFGADAQMDEAPVESLLSDLVLTRGSV